MRRHVRFGQNAHFKIHEVLLETYKVILKFMSSNFFTLINVRKIVSKNIHEPRKINLRGPKKTGCEKKLLAIKSNGE